MQLKNRLHTLKNKLRRAFTITELVIVIAVIAVLAAVLIPTFSNVINSSKKSADEAMLKQLNEATYHYSVNHPKALTLDSGYTNCDVVFTNLMTGLKEAGYTDETNPYLLACDIQQESKYLIWYYESNTFGLVDDITSALFATNYAPNFYTVSTGDSSTYGFLLSNYKSGDHGAYAAYYYAKATSDDADEALANFVSANSIWGAAVKQYLVNEAAGLTTSGADVSWANSVGTNSNSNTVQTITLSAKTSAAAAKNLVSILSVVSAGNTLKNTIVKFEQAEEPIDLTAATWTPLSDAHRDSMSTTSTFQGSVDFSNNEIVGLTINNNYISASASYQSQSDNGYSGGGYNVTYGLFGCLNGLDYAVEISNLTMTDCQVVLNGATSSIGGTSSAVITDCAGLVCGFAVGDVSFKNIKIGTEDTPCYIEGYDAVGGLVGRYYAYDNKDANRSKNSSVVYALSVDNCEIYANVYGERRSGGFIGYTGALNAKDENQGRISITNSKFEGLIYDDGELSDVEQYGALIGGMGSAGSTVGGAVGFYVDAVTINALVVAKNVVSASPVALQSGAGQSMVLYSGNDAGITIGSNGLTVKVLTTAIYTGASGGSNTYNANTLALLGSSSYSTLLPSMRVVTSGVDAVTFGAGQYLVGGTLDKVTVNVAKAS